MDWMEYRINEAQQLFPIRGNSKCYMAGRMAGCRDCLDAGDDFAFTVDKIELILDRGKVLCRELKKSLFEMVGHFECRKVGVSGPKLPLLLPHHVTGVGESWLTLSIEIPTDVVRMTVGEDNGVDVLGRNPFRF